MQQLEVADHQRSRPTAEQGECRTEIALRSLLAPCTVRCLDWPGEDPRATAPEVQIHLQAHRKGEHTPTSGCSRSGRPPASPPQHSRRGEQEIVGAVKPSPAEEQQGSRRLRTGPKRGEEERRSGRGWLRVSPPQNSHRGEQEIGVRCRAWPLETHGEGSLGPIEVKKIAAAGVTGRGRPLHEITTRRSGDRGHCRAWPRSRRHRTTRGKPAALAGLCPAVMGTGILRHTIGEHETPGPEQECPVHSKCLSR
ncbi:hypothetical protein NDU88_001507 [Pleurodeles waltl]|uniref:Uncharacterized protein n=1 Tax=Pleurodeles waltl TaxID=8319 RepID=A0AAV7U9J5_PLEWA|nr:hypothetical protein NDU88_001507 [Pleurodeles waltl]